jgi:hypothetical protein
MSKPWYKRALNVVGAVGCATVAAVAAKYNEAAGAAIAGACAGYFGRNAVIDQVAAFIARRASSKLPPPPPVTPPR